MSSFLGFSAFEKSSSRSETTTPKSPSSLVTGFIYSGEDSEIATALKKITKKDETTKLRGISDFITLIQTKDKSLLRNAIPAFLGGTGLFVDLCLHNDRRIRTSCMHAVREYVCVGLRRAFSNQLLESLNKRLEKKVEDEEKEKEGEEEDDEDSLQKIIAVTPSMAILLVLCDPVTEVSKAAESAFLEIFAPPPPPTSPISSPGSIVSNPTFSPNQSPELARLEALSIFAPEVFPRLIRLLTLTSAQVSDMRSVSIEEADERIERIHASALDVLSLFASVCYQTNEHSSSSVVEQLDTTFKFAKTIRTVLFRSQLASDACSVLGCHIEGKSPSIRRSVFRLLYSICKFAPLLLVNRSFSRTKLSLTGTADRDLLQVPVLVPSSDICSLVLSCCVSEKASQAQSSAFETVRIFIQTYPLMFGYLSQGNENEESDDFISSIVSFATHFALSEINSFSFNSDEKSVGTVAPAVDFRKMFWLKLIDQLKHSCYGSGEAVYPHILSILVLFPSQLLLIPYLTPNKTGIALQQQSMISRILVHILGGLRNQSSEESLTHQGQLCAVQSFCDIAVLSLAVATRTTSGSQIYDASLSVEQQVFGLFAFLLSTILLENSASEKERIEFIRMIISAAMIDNALDAASAGLQELGFTESSSEVTSASASLGRGIRDCISSGLARILKQLEDISHRRQISGKSISRIESIVNSMWKCVEASLVKSTIIAPLLCKRVISSLILEDIQSDQFESCMRNVSEALSRNINDKFKSSVLNSQIIVNLSNTLLMFAGMRYMYMDISPITWLSSAASLLGQTSSSYLSSSADIIAVLAELSLLSLQLTSTSNQETFFECLCSVLGESVSEMIHKNSFSETIAFTLLPHRIVSLVSFFKRSSSVVRSGKFSLILSNINPSHSAFYIELIKTLSVHVIKSQNDIRNDALNVLVDMKNLGLLTKSDEEIINRNATETAVEALFEIYKFDSTSDSLSRLDSNLSQLCGWYSLRSRLCDMTCSIQELIHLWKVESLLKFCPIDSFFNMRLSDIEKLVQKELEALVKVPSLLSEVTVAIEDIIRHEISQLETSIVHARAVAALLSNISSIPGVVWETIARNINLWSFTDGQDYILIFSWLITYNNDMIFNAGEKIGVKSKIHSLIHSDDCNSASFPFLLSTSALKVIYDELNKSVSTNDTEIASMAFSILSELIDTVNGDESILNDEVRKSSFNSAISTQKPCKERLLAAKLCLSSSLKRVNGIRILKNDSIPINPLESLALQCLSHSGKWETKKSRSLLQNLVLGERTKSYQSTLINLCAAASSNCGSTYSFSFSADRIASIGRAASHLQELLAADARLGDLSIIENLFPSPHPLICGIVSSEALHNVIISYMLFQTEIERRKSLKHIQSLIATITTCWARRHMNFYPLLKNESIILECAALLIIKSIESDFEYLILHYHANSFDVRLALSGLLDSCILPKHSIPWFYDDSGKRNLTKEITKKVMAFSTEKWSPEIENEKIRLKQADTAASHVVNTPMSSVQPEISLASSLTSAVGTLFRVGASFVGSVFSDSQSNASAISTAAEAASTSVTICAQPPVPPQVTIDTQDDIEVELKRVGLAKCFFPKTIVEKLLKNGGHDESLPVIEFNSESENMYEFEDDDVDDSKKSDQEQMRITASRMWLQKSAVLQQGFGLLPYHVSKCLDNQGAIGRLELTFHEICASFEGEGSTAPSDSAFQDADYYLRCALRALCVLERSVDDQMFRSLSLYLSYEQKNVDDIVLKGADFSRVFEATMKLFLGLDDLFSSGVTSLGLQNPPSLEMALNTIEEMSLPFSVLDNVDAAKVRSAKIIILAMAFMIRFAVVAPSKFEEAFHSFPKGLKSEAERFISRYITTRIVEAHLTDAHKFASETRKLATTLSHSLVSVGCSEDDLSFSVQKVVSPESLIFSAAGLPSRASTKIKSFLRGQYNDMPDPLVSSPSSASTLDDTDIDFTIRGTRSSREIIGIYTVGEATVSAKISFPASYPLKKVSVSLVQRMGLTDNQSIPLEMQLTKLISNHGNSMTDVFSVLKQTVDSILRGIEPCPVCYCVLDSDSRLPKLSCSTCSNKYHKSCLMKWFSKSIEPTCPLCRQPWQGNFLRPIDRRAPIQLNFAGGMQFNV